MVSKVDTSGSTGEMNTAKPVRAARSPSSRMMSSHTRQAAAFLSQLVALCASSAKPSSQLGAAAAVSCKPHLSSH